LLSNILVAE